MSIRRVAALAVVVPILACGDAGTSDWAGTVVDSAGIPVVQNPTDGLWGPEAGWTVVEELSIGAMEGEDVYQFGQIIGVDVDADGNVYIADGQVQDVRVFDAMGTYVRTIGSAGSGPGELPIRRVHQEPAHGSPAGRPPPVGHGVGGAPGSAATQRQPGGYGDGSEGRPHHDAGTGGCVA
jgi:hypothetical protein